MNRQERRRTAAIERTRISGYQHRLFSAYANGLFKRGGFYHAVIEHDPWCTIYKGGGCNCVPHISISGEDGVIIIDTEGNGTTVRPS
jgi:Fe-S-cluster containining protein